ncbi:ISL3 family transposase [Metallibacterium scheffleri]|uniref:ISL3 family transposase n=1 Tax=Metallibacterium scheffleri TaxID=993689 RepID=UPI0023F2BF30|nr:ISL3 family transposase [Metallibacterium scheffleri]
METLFTQALGLSSPWRVVSVDFRPAEGVIAFQIDNTAKRLDCPACGAANQPIHDRQPRAWRHLHFFQYQAVLQARVPRVACTACEKTSQVEVPWAREGAGFTQTLEAFIVALCEQMPVLAVSQLLGVSDDRIWRVLDHYVTQARAREDYSAVRRISADERSARRGHRYVTMFCDADARRLLFATPGKDAATFEAFAEDLAAHGGAAKAITDVSLDLGAAYQAGARTQCPNAVVSFDPFHVIALANEALDQVRRAEVKQEVALKGCRWGTLKDAANWTHQQVAQMHWLQRSGLKTARAWRIKERLREVFAQCTDRAAAEALLPGWISWASRCRLAPFKRLGATVKKHLAGILEHFRSRLNNGFAEAINGRVQAAKVRAKGYGSDAHLITISYLVCAKLKHLPKNPWTDPAQQMIA